MMKLTGLLACAFALAVGTGTELLPLPASAASRSAHSFTPSAHSSTQLAGPSQADLATFSGGNKMRYIHVAAQFSKLTQDQVGQAVKAQLLDPIDSHLKHLARSYSYTVDGASRLNLSLVVEPTDSTGAKLLDSFVQAFDKKGFEGARPKFQEVVQIIEHVDFLAGQHVSGSSDDSFHADSELLREYRLASIQEWTKFTDRMGYALQTPVHADFLNYVAWLLGDAQSYQTYMATILNHDDLVFADLNPTLQFSDGSFSAPDASPFFDLPFARDCWEARFEKGPCGAGNGIAP